MLDISFIRSNPSAIKENIQRRGLSGDQFEVDVFLELDQKRSQLIAQAETLRAQRNELSDQSGKPSLEIIEKGRSLKESIKELEDELRTIEEKWQWYMDWFPNMLHPDVPDGKRDADNVEIQAWVPDMGYLSSDQMGGRDGSKAHMPTFSFEPKDHLTIGTALGIIDVETSALVSGSRFAYLKGAAALLQYGLFELLKNKLLEEGFTPMIVPLMVKERALYGSSHFPGDQDQVYKIDSEYIEENNQLYLVGSSEPSLFSYYMDKVVKESDLPQKFFAFTPCFRTEVGSWGKDVRGIKRVHQFDKVEMDLICHPDRSNEMQEYLQGINEWFFQQLQIPYHIIIMCSGDAGYFATAKKYDFEGWLPSQKGFIELGSNTNAWEYQARRYNTKFIDNEGTRRYVHNVNDTGCPIGRTIIAILDNYQQADGSVVVPEVLRKYVGKDVITRNS